MTAIIFTYAQLALVLFCGVLAIKQARAFIDEVIQ